MKKKNPIDASPPPKLLGTKACRLSLSEEIDLLKDVSVRVAGSYLNRSMADLVELPVELHIQAENPVAVDLFPTGCCGSFRSDDLLKYQGISRLSQ